MIKTTFAKIIIDNFNSKPYYSIKPYYCIMWLDPADNTYYTGYGSFNLDYVIEWLDKEFEIVCETDTDSIWKIENSGIHYGRHLNTYMIQKRYYTSGRVETNFIPYEFDAEKQKESWLKRWMKKTLF